MTTTVLRTFEVYQKARVQFVQTLAELASEKGNYEALQSADVVPSVSQTACIALARMAENSAQISEAIIELEILPDIVESIEFQNRFFKKCAAYVLKAIAKHSKELAMEVVKAGGLQALRNILDDYDPSVREAACWAISYIAKHDDELATAVTDIILLKDLVLCIQEPELALRRIAVTALMQIARHKPELANRVAGEDIALLPFLAPLIQHTDPKLKRQAIACISHIASHSQALAEKVIHYIKFNELLENLTHPDKGVRINTADCIKNLVRHKAESAKLICTNEGAKALISYIKNNEGAAREPALYSISYVSNFDAPHASTLLKNDVAVTLRDVLVNERDANIKLRAAHALGCIGQHPDEQSKQLADVDVLNQLLNIAIEEISKREGCNNELRDTCKEALKKIIQNCRDVPALNQLIRKNTPDDTLIQVLKQLNRIFPNNTPAKRWFAEKEGLKNLLLYKKGNSNLDKTVESLINDICKSFPKDLVNYYTPEFDKQMAEQIERFTLPNES